MDRRVAPELGSVQPEKPRPNAGLGRGTLWAWDAANCLVVQRAGQVFDAGATLDRHLQRAIARKFYIHDVLFQIDLDRVIGSEG